MAYLKYRKNQAFKLNKAFIMSVQKIHKILLVDAGQYFVQKMKATLQLKGYDVLPIAKSYEEATEIYLDELPDIVLSDIILEGKRTGVHLAQFICRQSSAKPFIFLSSTPKVSAEAMQTNPVGYLVKPLPLSSIIAMIEVALYNYKAEEAIRLKCSDGKKQYRISTDEILYLQSDHVYVNIVFDNNKKIIQRTSLKKVTSQLPGHLFARCHRSYVVNLSKVTQWGKDFVRIGEDSIPISRGYRKMLMNVLATA
jgi:DNA-binding LytR/AlgR family response regulator